MFKIVRTISVSLWNNKHKITGVKKNWNVSIQTTPLSSLSFNSVHQAAKVAVCRQQALCAIIQMKATDQYCHASDFIY